jgi:dethiobiotin synthetase
MIPFPSSPKKGVAPLTCTSPHLCVVGTDTSVGKTVFSSALCRFFLKKGLHVAAYKPAESGCPARNGRLFPPDSNLLLSSMGGSLGLDDINLYRFSHPLSPHAASVLSHEVISVERITNQHQQLAQNHDILVMEGAGGLMVPFAPSVLFADIIEMLNTPCIVVARSTLGTINHTLLTISELKRRQVPLLGFVLNKLTPDPALEEETNPNSISDFSKIPFLGVFPHIPISKRNDPDHLASSLEKSLDLSPIFLDD